jgi:hypothetical protein
VQVAGRGFTFSRRRKDIEGGSEGGELKMKDSDSSDVGAALSKQGGADRKERVSDDRLVEFNFPPRSDARTGALPATTKQ